MSKMKYSGVEWIGEIPKNWELKRIKYNLKQPITDGPHETPSFIDDGIPFLSVDCIQNNKLIMSNRYISYEDAKIYDKKCKPQYGDILMGKAASIGKIAIVDTKEYFQIWSPLALIRTDKNKLNNKFLKYYLESNCGQEYIEKYATKNTQKNIAMEDIEKIKIVIPNIKEQKLIADFLDKKVSNLDNILLDLNKQIEILNNYRKSLITESITKGLDKKVKFKESRVGKIPLNWETKPIKYICNIQPKVCYKNIRENDFVTFLPMDHIKKGYFINNQGTLYDNDNSYTSFEEGDIIMAKVTPCFENGNIAIAKNLHNGYGFGSSELFVFRTNDYVEQKFLFYWLQNDNFVKMATSNMTGAAGLKRVPLNFIRNYYISIPKLDEQKQIVEYLDKKCEQIDKIIEEKQKQIEKIEEYKKSVIYEYVTGKKRVEGAEESYG